MVGRKLIAAALLTSMASTSIAREHQHGNGEKLGTVHFATSCNEVAQTEFNRAVALLHSFQFSRAIEGFNAVRIAPLRSSSPFATAHTRKRWSAENSGQFSRN